MFSSDGNDDGVDAYDEDDDVACNIAISVALAWFALQTFIGLPGVGHTATTMRERELTWKSLNHGRWKSASAQKGRHHYQHDCLMQMERQCYYAVRMLQRSSGLQLCSSSSELWQIALLLELLLESHYCDVVSRAVALPFTCWQGGLMSSGICKSVP